jgi:hypothetical protein
MAVEREKMRGTLIAASLCGSMLVAGCASLLPRMQQPGSELVGQTLRMETSRGQVSTLQFRNNNIVRALFGKQEIIGRWQVEPVRLCFLWKGAPRECWPYPTPFRVGESRSITSDRGNAVRVTRL